MKIISLRTIFGFLIIALVVACSHLGSPIKDICIDDIEGSWENIHFGYIYLYIDKTGKGYFIPGLNDTDDIYKISSITYNGYSATITFIAINSDKDIVKAECTPFGADLLGFQPIDKNEKEDSLLFMRESKVEELRHKAKEFIKIEGLGT